MIKTTKLNTIAACILLGISTSTYAEENKVNEESTFGRVLNSVTGWTSGSFGSSDVAPQSVQVSPVHSDFLHYSIGGGAAISAPASRQRPNQYGVSLGWKSNLTCGNFDIKMSIKNQLNGITEGFKDLYSNVIESATGAVASLPAMIIQRANPQLYDILSNGIYQGKIDFNNFKTSCEAMSAQLADYALDSKWAKMAGLEQAKEIAETETDATKAKKEIEKESKKGEKGTTWVGGQKRGGKNQKPIEIISDVVGAGYNLALGRGATEKTPVSKVKCDGLLCSEWDTPEKAAAYAREILGEKTLSTCTTCGDTPVKSQAGRGLAPKIEEGTIAKAKQLEAVLNNVENVTAEQLNELSTSTLAVTRGLIESLSQDPDAAILGARLAQELAISRELEKAFLVRRMLLAGMKEPNVENNQAAQEDLEKSLKLLDREIEQVKLEMELQRSMNSNSALATITNRMRDQSNSIDDSGIGDSNSRFANLTKEVGANTADLSGINYISGGTARRGYIAIPKSDNSGVGNIYGKFAEGVNNTSANIGNRASNSTYTPINNITGTALEQAQGLLRQFEGYISKPKYDVNALRAGYGSDTYTTADGTVHRVTSNSVVSREDAERDLARRTQIFANTARNNVSTDVWNKLPPKAQAVLTSISYNYGSLTNLESVRKAAAISAQSGDMTTLANAIRKLQVHNNGINARRRNQEADYMLN